MVKINPVTDSREEFLSLAGSITDLDSTKIKSVIKKIRGYSSRKISEFS